jgi:hypothetical protein
MLLIDASPPWQGGEELLEGGLIQSVMVQCIGGEADVELACLCVLCFWPGGQIWPLVNTTRNEEALFANYLY